MTLAASMVRAERCSLANVRTGESLDCLFNPPQLLERIQVNWSRLAPLGLSHHVLQYQSTGNRSIGPLEFYVERFFARALESDPDVLAFAAFMRALTVPPADVADIALAAPPRLLIVWPRVLTVETVLTELELRFTDFAGDGSALAYTASCTFEEILDVRRVAPDATPEAPLAPAPVEETA